MTSSRRSVLLSAFLAAGASTLLGCGSDKGNSPPAFEALRDQTIFVNDDFSMTLKASDADNDTVSFGFRSTIADIANRASLRPAGNTALFQWTPIASDLGQQSFDFSATDGKDVVWQTVTFTVNAGTEGSGPVFRQPLGTGTTLDLTKQKCLELQVVVEDADSAGVDIKQEDPLIPTATLDQTSGLSAVWNWCPGKDQIANADRYNLRLSANDNDNPPAYKNYLIVLRRTFDPNCGGEAPVITHTPQDEDTVLNLSITADISDDKGMKYEPLLYYSTTAPSDPPDLAQMSQVTMVLLDGDMKSGTWGADVPNPVAGKPAGTTAQLYYLMVAQDNDDETGACDHLTQVPESGTYSITVTNPGGSGGLGLCKPCSSDSQCGGDADHCLYMGSEGNSYCFKACATDTECGDPAYYCSSSAFTSIDGASSRQCIPLTYSCDSGGGGECVDDSYEQNDTRDEANLIYPGLEPGSYANLKSCPSTSMGADEDWYPIDIYEDSEISATITGGSSSDLDLALMDGDGNLVVKSDTLSSNESITQCVPFGTYFLRVDSWDQAENSYSLTFDLQPKSCGGSTGTCDDDASEPDNNASQARQVDLVDVYKSDTNAICAGNEDWYQVELFADETISAAAAFDQANAKEDLDILFYQGTTLLTKCTETDPSGCDASNGQSSNSNETFQKTVTTGGTYYVVVRGWDGSENLYDMCIGLSATDCPKP